MLSIDNGKYMNKLLTLTTLLISINLHAYVPSVESLFSNGNNPEIGKNSVVANIEITRNTKEESNLLNDIPAKTTFKLLVPSSLYIRSLS